MVPIRTHSQDRTPKRTGIVEIACTAAASVLHSAKTSASLHINSGRSSGFARGVSLIYV